MSRDDANLVAKTQRWLKRFGYLQADFAEGVLDEPTHNALSEFQRRRQIQEGGQIGSDTLLVMSEPRCGMWDVIPESTLANLDDGGAGAGCSFRGAQGLTYAFRNRNGGKHLDDDWVNKIIFDAFRDWVAVINIPISPSPDLDSANFRIGWFDHEHAIGDIACVSFHGAGNTIAHAFPPQPCSLRLAGECHFDADETWDIATGSGLINLKTVALHEIGHLLGLVGHSSGDGDVMNAEYRDMGETLSANDIISMRRLYRLGPRLNVEVDFEGIERLKFRDGQLTEPGERPGIVKGFRIEFFDSLPQTRLRYTARINGDYLPFVDDGVFIGAEGKGPISEFAVELIGAGRDNYDVCYSAMIAAFGLTATYQNGEFCGKREGAAQLESIRVWLEPKL